VSRKKLRQRKPRLFTPSKKLRRILRATKTKKQSSKWELDLAAELAKKFFVTSNNRSILRPYEVDIVFSERFGGQDGLLEVNGPVHYTPAVYGEDAHKRSHRNDMRKLHRAQRRQLKILLIPAQHRMPSKEEVEMAIALYERAEGSFSMLFARMGKISTPVI